VKNGDATRTLVGLAITAAGPAFVDTSTQIGVLSWFNRLRKSIIVPFTSSPSTAANATPGVELSPSFRALFLCWADEAVEVAGDVNASSTVAGSVAIITGVTFDGSATAEDAFSQTASNAASQSVGSNFGPHPKTLSEGAHFASLTGRTGSGTATWVGGATVANRTSIKMIVRG
jgi:hypothetical protein